MKEKDSQQDELELEDVWKEIQFLFGELEPEERVEVLKEYGLVHDGATVPKKNERHGFYQSAMNRAAKRGLGRRLYHKLQERVRAKVQGPDAPEVGVLSG